MRPPFNRASRQDRGDRWGYCRPHFAVTAVVLILAHLALVPVHAQDTLLNQARAHMADGNPQAAYDLLSSQEASLAGDPGFDYLLGIAAMDGGRLTYSIFAQERVLAVEPDNLLARAEIARVYLMLGEVRTSQQEFETLSKSEDLPSAARSIVEGFFAGQDGSHAGLAYETSIPGNSINGAAAFEKD
jgi:hypothetical protein